MAPAANQSTKMHRGAVAKSCGGLGGFSGRGRSRARGGPVEPFGFLYCGGLTRLRFDARFSGHGIGMDGSTSTSQNLPEEHVE